MIYIKSIFLSLILTFPSGVALGVTWEDLVRRDGLYYKKFTDIPFNGEMTGKHRVGKIVDGKKEGYWTRYHDNGQLFSKGNYKDGLPNGYHENWNKWGFLDESGNFKGGVKIGYWQEYFSSEDERDTYCLFEPDPNIWPYNESGVALNCSGRGHYQDGKREGYWEFGPLIYGNEKKQRKFYDGENKRKFVATGTYKNGVKIGN